MRGRAVQTPDLVPVLSPGRHRNPRKGACFMEMASFLAGERWSDHPSCTHPLLAGAARRVNDSVGEEARADLVPLIPSVIGLTGEDPRIAARLALSCATAALPYVSASRQNVLAVGVQTCERMLAGLEGRPETSMTATGRAALHRAPDAERWASRHVRPGRLSQRVFVRQTAPHVVAYAIDGLAEACIDDRDGRLVALLRECIVQAKAVVDQLAAETAAAVAHDAPVAAPERHGSRLRA